MTSLIIDTCNSNLTIGIVKDNNILSIYNEQVKTDLSTKIFPVMQDVFVKVGVDPKDIDTIFVSCGPGSFTGIRIGVTVAKTYAWALNKKIIPFSSLELLATTKVKEDYLVPIIDARRGYVYAGIYDEHLDTFMNDQYISIEDLEKSLEGKYYKMISYDEFEKFKVIKPEIDILKLIEKHKKDSGVNPHKINPNYLKLTEAEMKLGEK
ncbi:MAG: tRNA (adenosine(37)-N6)-threonylcarbamoyltransferase complex dimerization subunit type 1 TsaB [Firmicutes bacterium]|nr:tRNA (adenosine(37)-N6)-threonylcarbamoyltransferase complex dimerization subunit type 1 TsaB [Bacillota bacterium]